MYHQKKNFKETKGITLIALVLTIIILLILAGVTISALSGDNGILNNATKAKEETEKASREENAILQGLLDEMDNINPSTDGFNEAKNVNSPKLSQGMIPIKYNGSNWVVCAENDDDWYSYDNNKKWANVMLSDGKYKEGQVQVGQVVEENELGSMYVWIPRYAYQIKGTNSIEVTFLAGNTNKDGAGTEYAKESAEVDTTVTKIVHPGFTLGSRELRGIWVAKFEASGTDSNGNAVGNASADSASQKYAPVSGVTIAKSLPNKKSWRHITIGESEYQSMLIAGENKDKYGLNGASSHLIKNNEWGAVAYLCYSNYGNIPKTNSCGTVVQNSHWYDLYTGQGPKTSTNENWYPYEEGHGYDTAIGMLSSTTGNITGVYDMAGGANERVAGYLDNGNGNLNNNGKSTSNSSIKYFENGVLKTEYKNLWNSYEVSEEEKTNKIMIEGEETLTQSQLWDWNKNDLKYQVVRKRLTEAIYKNMAVHKGIGINEVSTEFSFYAPYKPAETATNQSPWGWFKNPETAAKSETTQEYAKAWSNDNMLIGYASMPFVLRGGYCNSGSGAGVLCAFITYGYASHYYGFRAVLVV